MIVVKTEVTVVIECDVGFCDSGGGPIQATRKGVNSGDVVTALKEGGWLVFDMVRLEICPSCVRQIAENRKKSKESIDGS